MEVLYVEKVCWKGSKEDATVDFIAKAKNFNVLEVAKEDVQIKKQLIELGVGYDIVNSIEIYCYNNEAITQIKELMSH